MDRRLKAPPCYALFFLGRTGFYSPGGNLSAGKTEDLKKLLSGGLCVSDKLHRG